MNKQMSKINFPIAKRLPYTVKHPNGDRQDPYFWMRLSDEQKAAEEPDQQTQDVLNYLKAENEYTHAILKDTEGLQKEIYEEIVGRMLPDESSVPYLSNGFFYQTTYAEGQEYPIYKRRMVDREAFQVLMDVNQEAEPYEYYQLGGLSVSDDNTLLAYSEDVVSRRQYTIRVRSIISGENLEDIIPNTTGSIVWHKDNQRFYYVVKDEALRAFKIYEHVLGNKPSDDICVYHETDERFRVYVYRSKDKRYMVIGSASSLTTEYRYMDLEKGDGKWTLFQERITGLEYHITSFHDQWLVLNNHDKASNFKLSACTRQDTALDQWKTFIPYDPAVFIEDVEVCNDYVLLAVRHEGNTKIKVHNSVGENPYYVDFGTSAYTAHFSINREMDTHIFRLGFTSMTTPNSVLDLNLENGKLELLKEQKVLGDFNKEDYESRREMAIGHNGTPIPISIVYSKKNRDLSQKPMLLYAYGSYGYSMDPYFSISRLSLLDRGFSFAIAHIRGGSENGRDWYEKGKFLFKKNTFLDFISCGEHLKKHHLVQADQLYAMGGSAGGLLMGAVMNMAPQLWAGVVAAVPFVDVLSTMIDESIPLTVGEYEEWGNPNDPEYFEYIKSYSPYDNIEEKDYPALLITTGYHDSQVQYWEPAKWAAKLRHYKTDENILLLYTNLDTGHGGASGRYRRFKETAMEYAFLLKCAGMVE
jgi:oligopeptidase B